MLGGYRHRRTLTRDTPYPVPDQWLPRARDVLAAFERGDYGLSDDEMPS